MTNPYLPYLLPHRTGWSVMFHISVDLWSVKSSSQVDFLVVVICCKGLNFQVLSWWKEQLLILLKQRSHIGHPSKPCFGMAHRLVSVWVNAPLFHNHKVIVENQWNKGWNHEIMLHMLWYHLIWDHTISYHTICHIIPYHFTSYHITLHQSASLSLSTWIHRL